MDSGMPLDLEAMIASIRPETLPDESLDSPSVGML
jgi:hypothetical protein